MRAFLAEFKDFYSFLFAFLALIVSSVSLFFTFFWLQPNIQVIKGSTIQVSYVPKGSEFRLDFRITIANYGRRMDVVKWIQGELSSQSANSPTIYFSSRTGDFTLKEASHGLPFPLTVADKTAIDVDGSLSQVLGTATKNSLFQKPGQRGSSRSLMLRINLKTATSKDASTRFCFEVQDEVLANIENGSPKEISVVECRGAE